MNALLILQAAPFVRMYGSYTAVQYDAWGNVAQRAGSMENKVFSTVIQ